jgi:hypothetical protein
MWSMSPINNATGQALMSMWREFAKVCRSAEPYNFSSARGNEGHAGNEDMEHELAHYALALFESLALHGNAIGQLLHIPS